MRCCDQNLVGWTIKFIVSLMTATAFECQTNRGSQVVCVRPMGWAVCMVIMSDREPDDSDRVCQNEGVGGSEGGVETH